MTITSCKPSQKIHKTKHNFKAEQHGPIKKIDDYVYSGFAILKIIFLKSVIPQVQNWFNNTK